MIDQINFNLINWCSMTEHSFVPNYLIILTFCIVNLFSNFAISHLTCPRLLISNSSLFCFVWLLYLSRERIEFGHFPFHQMTVHSLPIAHTLILQYLLYKCVCGSVVIFPVFVSIFPLCTCFFLLLFEQLASVYSYLTLSSIIIAFKYMHTYRIVGIFPKSILNQY